jgi:nucleotide-binding universal stress UspA family protein
MSVLGTKRFQRVMVALDGSESSNRAFQVGIDLTLMLKAELTILHIVEIPTSIYFPPEPIEVDVEKIQGREMTEGEKLVSNAASLAESKGLKAGQKVMRHMGSVAEGIREYADKNGIDLIVMGTRGLGGVKRLLFSSVAGGVVSNANCSVLVVR